MTWFKGSAALIFGDFSEWGTQFWLVLLGKIMIHRWILRQPHVLEILSQLTFVWVTTRTIIPNDQLLDNPAHMHRL